MTSNLGLPTPSSGTTKQAVGQVVTDDSIPAYVWLFLAGLGFSMFSGNSFYLGLPVSLDRPLYLLAVVLLVLDHRTSRLRWRPVLAAMAATLLWTSWSWLDTGSLLDSQKAFALSDRIALPFIMFLLGPVIFSTTARRDLLLKFMTLLGAYLAVTGICEFLNFDALVWPRYIVDASIGIGSERARGPFLGSEAFGMTTGLAVFSSAYLATRSRDLWQAVAIAVAGLSLIATAFSLTRSAWIGTAVGLIAVALADRRLRRCLPMALGAAAAIGVAVAVALPSVANRFTSRATTARSVDDRVLTNDAGFRILDAHPLTGIGWQNFLGQTSDWVRQADTFPLTNTNIEIHNVFLSRAAETGIIGAALWALVVFLGPVLGLIRSGSRTDEEWGWKLVAVGALCIWVVPSLTSPNPYPLPNFLVWLISGVAVRRYLVASPQTSSAGTA